MKRLLILLALFTLPAVAQTMKPRMRIVSDTSNGCQQTGTVSWQIYDTAADGNVLTSGSISITAVTTAPVCYRSIRAQLAWELETYVDSNNILEPGGGLAATGIYPGELLLTYRTNDATTGTIQWRIATSTPASGTNMIVAPTSSPEVLAGICIENCA